MDLMALLIGIVAGVALSAIALIYIRRNDNQVRQEQEMRTQNLLQEARDKSEAMVREADQRNKEERKQFKAELDREYKRHRKELKDQKNALADKERQLDKRFSQLDKKDDELERRRSVLEKDRRAVEETRNKHQQLLKNVEKRLEEVAHFTRDEAKAALMTALEDEARQEAGRMLKQLEDEARDSATKRAQDFIATAIQRFAGEFVAEHTVSVVNLPNDDMKGRIIGREGRNIRALEAATGCDLIIDDTPEAVVISGFDPVRRQVARRALEELVTDGRIHPARIEEIVRKANKGINAEIREAGEQVVFDLGMRDLHPELVKLLGALKFRTSYTQNVLNHSIEVAYFAGIMAEELGLDGDLARRCGLLHDIGKAIDHDRQGSHAVLGGQLVKRYKEHPIVINSVWSHHFDIEPDSVYGPLTNAADALSAARPGARRENVETYIKRLENLERIASDFGGVDKAYAIQAGRELRVMVSYNKVSDEGSLLLARDIARRVEDEMTYPGQIKVTVIREMRATEVAH
ncbi:MAG: ribonuclease Y [Magnetococcales bacterium]|nr:ribonuclease Y [Magnetococcales bacterium]